MNCCMNENRTIIVKTFYKSNERYAGRVRKLGSIFGQRMVPNESSLQCLVWKIEKTSFVGDAISYVSMECYVSQ